MPKINKRLNRTDVEDLVKEILVQHGLFSVPVDPVILANKLGVKVNNAKFVDDSWAAMISKRDDAIRIFVEQSDPPYRKRFSIAHELGHHFLHLPQDGEIVDKRADMFRQRAPAEEAISPERLREIQANWFAAALLMPADLVRREWELNSNLKKLAIQFNVSEEAMGYRLDSLGLWPPQSDS